MFFTRKHGGQKKVTLRFFVFHFLGQVIQHAGYQLPKQGSNLQWKYRIQTTGLPGNFQTWYISSAILARAPTTKYPRLADLNNINLFLIVLETGKSKIGSGSNTHSIGQNSVTWPYLTAKEARKCSPVGCLTNLEADSATDPSLFIFNSSWPLFKLIMTLSIPEQKPDFCPLVGTQTVFRFSYHKPLGYQSSFKVELWKWCCHKHSCRCCR